MPRLSTTAASRIVAKGDHDRAIADYSEAIRLDPKHASAFNNRGIAYRAKGDHDRAIADYNEAIRLDPKDALAFNNRGIAYRAKGDHDRAIADYSEAIRLDPNDALAFNNRGNAYRAKDDIDAAIADYSEVIRLDPKHASAFSNRGWMSFTKGDFQDAAADAIRAIEIEADANKILLRFLARARGGEAAGPELDANAGRLKTKEWPFAVIEMLTGKSTPEATLRAARKPGEVCMAHFYIGEWHLLRDQKTEAATALQRAAEMCPKEYLNLNAARAELKRLGAGRDAAEQAKSGPEHGTANQLQARVDTQPSSPFLNRTIDPGVRVEFERFLEMLDQVLRVNPKSESALAHRCFVRAIFGQLQQATTDCDDAMRLQPNNSHIRDARGLTHLLLGRYDNAIADYDVATRTRAAQSQIALWPLTREATGGR